MNNQTKFSAIPACLADLAAQPRWVVWKWENRTDKHGNTKPTKPPHKAAGGRVGGYASNDNAATWTTLETAQRAYATGQCDGIGLQLLDLKGYAAIDLDDVRDSGAYMPWAQEAIAAAGSYAEHTPSGNGGRIIGRVPDDFPTFHTKLQHPHGGSFEVYSNLTTGKGRYITMTGDSIDGTPDALADISAIIRKLMDDAKPKEETETTSTPFDFNAGFYDLPGWALDYLTHGGSGDRSGDFQSVVNTMRPRGWTFEAALKAFQDNPTGPASKYLAGDRLEAELRRAWDKAKAPGPEHKPGSIAGDDVVDLWGTFDPPELPHGLLPAVIEKFALVQGQQMGADPAGLAIAALVTCAATITDKVQLQVKQHDRNWRESPRIWAALVGSPSTKKSPILSAATSPLCAIDQRMFADFVRKMKEYEALETAEKKVKEKPRQKRLRIGDTTPEAAQEVLYGSPDGVMLLQDELSGFFGAMDRYGGKGASADRAFWLQAFNGGQYAINRVMRGAGLIENLSVCLLGGIQPEPIRRVASDAQDDGLLQRLFPVVLKQATLGQDAPAPDVVGEYAFLVEQLHFLQPPGFMGDGVLTFDAGAQIIRRDLEARHLALQSSEAVSRKLGSHIGKYDGLFARLCIVWHCIEHSDKPHDLPCVVTEATAQRVSAFLHDFLLKHAVAFYGGILGLSDDHDRLQAIAGFILARKLERVTHRDVQRGDRAMRGIKDHEIRPLLEQLAALGWLEQIEGPRPSSQPHWIVNPAVHHRFADRAAQESTRREEARNSIQAMLGGAK